WSSVALDEIREVRLRHWCKPPVFLVGDAAHAMSPDLGQGGNSAMVDAVVLVRLLGEASSIASLDEVGRRYETIRRRFVGRLQSSARIAARMRFVSSTHIRALRDLVLKLQAVGPVANATVRQWGGYNRREERYFGSSPT